MNIVGGIILFIGFLMIIGGMRGTHRAVLNEFITEANWVKPKSDDMPQGSGSGGGSRGFG